MSDLGRPQGLLPTRPLCSWSPQARILGVAISSPHVGLRLLSLQERKVNYMCPRRRRNRVWSLVSSLTTGTTAQATENFSQVTQVTLVNVLKNKDSLYLEMKLPSGPRHSDGLAETHDPFQTSPWVYLLPSIKRLMSPLSRGTAI